MTKEQSEHEIIDNMINSFYDCKTDEEKRNSELYNVLVNQQGLDEEDVLDEDVALDAMGISQALGIECQCLTCREVN